MHGYALSLKVCLSSYVWYLTEIAISDVCSHFIWIFFWQCNPSESITFNRYILMSALLRTKVKSICCVLGDTKVPHWMAYSRINFDKKRGVKKVIFNYYYYYFVSRLIKTSHWNSLHLVYVSVWSIEQLTN